MHNNPIIGLAYRRYGNPTPFGILPEDRARHAWLLGQTGTGKSTLLKSMALQEARLGQGFCLLDPHGDLALDLHTRIEAPHRYWDVADPASPLGYNPLQRVGAAFRPLVASGLVDSLKKQWPDAWGARMEHLLRYTILALLEQPTADLRDIMRLLVYKGYRRQVIEEITDPQVRFFWKAEFSALNYQTGADAIGPISNKLGAFLAHPVVRTVLCEPQEPLRFRQIMDRGEILLVNLAKGRLGSDVSNVLGGLITSSLMNAAFSRHDTPEHERRSFGLYIDEFHSFTTRTFADMMSEARKYGLVLTLCHQHLSQIDTATRDAIVGNVGSMITFRVGAHDAPFFERLYEPFTADDLCNQPNHRAVIWMILRGERVMPFTVHMLPPN